MKDNTYTVDEIKKVAHHLLNTGGYSDVTFVGRMLISQICTALNNPEQPASAFTEKTTLEILSQNP